ncbi:MAG TPA: vanadium-dependent haloperoxidase [Vicinamibacterales bacterium]|nr:vanadium-dependent haloperoxidase [Vicinamibacterales bacterium]
MKTFARIVLTFLLAAAVGSPAAADEVTDWNQAALRAALIGQTSPTTTTRVMALVQVAVFDAVNGLGPQYAYFRVDPAGAPVGGSKRAAAVQAAYAILTRLYGSGAPTPNAAQQAALEARRNVSLGEVAKEDSPSSITSGIAWGQYVADQVFAWRAADGFSVTAPFPDGSAIGVWRRTPNLPVSSALSAAGAGYLQLSHQVPWAMASPSAFRPGPPPSLSSAQYAADFNEVKTMGSLTSTARTQEQTANALFWNSATVSYLWQNIAVSLILRGQNDEARRQSFASQGRNGLVESARILGAMSVAMADATIGCWDAKYVYAYWRPITAVRDPGDDGNAATTSDPTWMPLFATPGHPEYPSGHSCNSGAAAAVLAHEFGENAPFTIDSDLMLGVQQTYHGPGEALEKVKEARIYAGIHFRTATHVGTELGAAVANFVLENKFQKLN